MKNILHKSFIAPFQSLDRTLVYLSAILGQFGFYGLLVYLAFDLTDNNMGPVISFFTAKFVISNMLITPILCMIIRRYNIWRTIIYFAVVQAGAFIVLYVFREPFLESPSIIDAFLLGTVISFISEAFWATYHAMMLNITSDDNRSHEVSVALMGLRIGSTFGAMAAGLALTFMPGTTFLFMSAIALIIPTLFMGKLFLKFSRETDALKLDLLKPYKIVYQDKDLTILTMFQGIMSALTGFYAPIWLKFVGFSALATGGVLAAQVFARIVIGPITGYLYEKGKGQELTLGAILYNIAWIPWLFLANALVFMFSAVFWSLYSHLVTVGLDSRWYEKKTLTSMASREICLGLGRMACCFVLLPLLAIATPLFFVGSILTGFLVIIYVRKAYRT